MAKHTSKVGDRVTYSGYPGTVTRICEWSDSMVEVRLKSGTACVDESDLKQLYPAYRHDGALVYVSIPE